MTVAVAVAVRLTVGVEYVKESLKIGSMTLVRLTSTTHFRETQRISNCIMQTPPPK